MFRKLIYLVLWFVGAASVSAEKVIYTFTSERIDVVIPCVEKDLETLHLCIEGIQKHGIGIGRIIVISKTKFTDEAEWFDEAKYPFSIEDVAATLCTSNSEPIEDQKGRTGWYYQQLLKLYAPLVIPGISSNVLILDSDVIFLSPVAFLNDANGAMFNPGTEYHIPYFQHASRLLPGFQKLYRDYSGISHHMVFQRPMIEDLFQRVEMLHHAPFWAVFCALVDPAEIIYSGASEYEIYFNYALSKTDQVSLRPLKWKNIRRMKDIEIFEKQGYQYVCLHAYDREKE